MRHFTQVVGPAKGLVIAQELEKGKAVVVIASTLQQVELLEGDIQFFSPSAQIQRFLPWDTLAYEHVSPQPSIIGERLLALNSLQEKQQVVVLTTLSAVLQRVLPVAELTSGEVTINVGETLDKHELLQNLVDGGYHLTSLVESVGQCAVRGSVIDYFSPHALHPIRVELLDTIVEEVRSFEPSTQRSIESLQSARLFPMREWMPLRGDAGAPVRNSMIARIKQLGKEQEVPAREIARVTAAIRSGARFPGMELTHLAAYENLNSFFDIVPPETLVIFNDYPSLVRDTEFILDELHERFLKCHARTVVPPPSHLALSVMDFEQSSSRFDSYSFNSLSLASSDSEDTKEVTHLKSSSLVALSIGLQRNIGTGNALEPLRGAITQWRKKGKSIGFVVGTPSRAQRLHQLLLQIDIDAPLVELTPHEWLERRDWMPVAILSGTLSSGFELPSADTVFIAEQDIFKDRSRRTGKKKGLSLRRIMNSLAQLSENNFVVHEDYGVAIYRGLKHFVVDGTSNDFLQLEFADTTLYLPIYHIRKVQKFIASEGVSPALDRVGSSRWKNTKEKVKHAVVELAGELLRMYAHRKASTGWRFEPLNSQDEEFSDSFPYDETPDQASAIESTLNDMASDTPMDRLICGDVGFGKTEVALRASHKCIQHCRQVAVLVPTTILAEQHLESFRKRFFGYPVVIEGLSRFYTPTQVKETLSRLKEGVIDIVVGTHKLLSQDVEFKDLGLIVVDEEHRFGVKQKEKLKAFKSKVDILTLTATPIPRTLNMALLGIRDISVIATAPTDRRVIRTYVAERETSLVEDAVKRELQRGGQIFYVINRIEALAAIASSLQVMVPHAKIVTAYGQMKESLLEDIMSKFVGGEIDILVTTTIIESGIDVPRANTIIIDNAHLFGMAQLYQLRGRVGRGHQQAYAYLLIPKLKNVSQEAQERLKALQSLDDLGVGFQLAMRDLEIRGAGNLLGKEQSGNVAAVGYELYMKILEEAVASLQGEEVLDEDVRDPDIKLKVDAYLPSSYVPDIAERLLLYQRICGVKSEEQISALSEELEDRFGPLPYPSVTLLGLSSFRLILQTYRIKKAEVVKNRLQFSLSSSSPVSMDKLMELLAKRGDEVQFTKNLTLSLSLPSTSFDKILDTSRALFDLIRLENPQKFMHSMQ